MEKKHTVALFFASLAVCAVFGTILPFFGFISMLVLPAVYGVCLGASKNVLLILSPIPGLCLAGLLWKSPAVTIAGLLFLIPGIVLAICLRKGASVTVTSLATALSYAVIFGGVLTAFAVIQFGSIKSAMDSLVSFVTSYINETFDYAVANDTTGSMAEMVSKIPVDKYVASLVMVLPGTFIVMCEVFGYALSHMSRLVIRIFPVPMELYPDKRAITLPVSVALLFIASFVVSLIAGDGVVYYVAENLTTVLSPPLFIVGLSVFRSMLKLLPSGRKTIFILFFIMLCVFSPAVGIYSVSAAGVIGLISEYFRRKRIK